jgi:hypothetical protein
MAPKLIRVEVGNNSPLQSQFNNDTNNYVVQYPDPEMVDVLIKEKIDKEGGEGAFRMMANSIGLHVSPHAPHSASERIGTAVLRVRNGNYLIIRGENGELYRKVIYKIVMGNSGGKYRRSRRSRRSRKSRKSRRSYKK